MRYIVNQNIKRIVAIAVMVGYTYFQLQRIHDMTQLDWILVVAVNVVGIIAIVVFTAKIRIAHAYIRHHRQGGH